MYASAHYQWQGEALYDAANGPLLQGKISDAFNSYCINILGNWNACGSCHAGLGARPVLTASPTDEQLKNIDCLVCHQKDYKRVKVNGVFVPDTANMTISLTQAVQTVHRPDRAACLSCHAKAGGGDAVKRGDLALASATTSDTQYDVHMSTAGADLKCQACHTTQNHRIAGKGSDLRETDLDVAMACTNCHTDKASSTGHATADVNRHVGRVACQTCHIPTYAKNAADTAATEATETHRTWKSSTATAPPYHPSSVKANNLTPEYRFWNRYSTNYRLGDVAQLDPITGAYPTSRPDGAVDDTSPDNKLYPFKYKTAEQPLMTSSGKLIAVDTSVYLRHGQPGGRHPGRACQHGILRKRGLQLGHDGHLPALEPPGQPCLPGADVHGLPRHHDPDGSQGRIGLWAESSPSHGLRPVPRPGRPARASPRYTGSTSRRSAMAARICHTFSRPERNLN